MWYFYVLKSVKDGKYYYGSTSDLRRRVKEHNDGKVKSTSPRKPFTLVYYEAFLVESLARSRERQVKDSRGTRTALLKRINIPG